MGCLRHNISYMSYMSNRKLWSRHSYSNLYTVNAEQIFWGRMAEKWRGVIAVMGIESCRKGVLAPRRLKLPIQQYQVLLASYCHKHFIDHWKMLCSLEKENQLRRPVFWCRQTNLTRSPNGITDGIKGDSTKKITDESKRRQSFQLAGAGALKKK